MRGLLFIALAGMLFVEPLVWRMQRLLYFLHSRFPVLPLPSMVQDGSFCTCGYSSLWLVIRLLFSEQAPAAASYETQVITAAAGTSVQQGLLTATLQHFCSVSVAPSVCCCHKCRCTGGDFKAVGLGLTFCRVPPSS